MNNDKYVAVIGAANIDIGGTPYNKLIPADSNPGTISISYGGVGRNISHNLSLLGVDVRLITATGDDVLGSELIRYCCDAGIDMRGSLTVNGSNSSSYLYINDADGDMNVAISHVDIVNSITPEYIDDQSDIIENACMVLADCNLSHDTIIHIKDLCSSLGVPLCIDPVSQTHALKIRGYLDEIYMLKPNLLEAELLTGININSDEDIIRAAHSIIDQGVSQVYISMGDRGMLAADKNDIYYVSNISTDVVSTTGAGDAATAAIIWASMQDVDCDILTCAKAANAAAAMTIEVRETNNPSLTPDYLDDIIQNYSFNIKHLSM